MRRNLDRGLRDSANQWRCGCYNKLSSNYVLLKVQKKKRQLTIPDSTTPHREKNANHEKRRGKVCV